MGDLGIPIGILTLHSDSMSVIQLAQNPIFHAKEKHVEVKYHFFREILEDKHIELVKIIWMINCQRSHKGSTRQ